MASENIGMTAIKPEGWDRTGFEAFKYFIYNPDTGEILSRTPLSWLKITLFYCVYYTLLAGFWIGCLHIFFMTIPSEHPRWLLDASIIGSNPGLGIRPKPTDERIDSSMFVLKIGERDTKPTDENGEGDKNIDYAVRVRNYMDMYTNITGLEDCHNMTGKSNETKCIFDTTVLGECGDYPYGFTVESADLGPQEGFRPGSGSGSSGMFAEPCVFLKLNKIQYWQPTPIKCEDASCTVLQNEKYDKMSPKLKNKIAAAHYNKDTDYVWVDCFGRYAADQESINLEYFPNNQGMATKYFPYKGGNYHAPLVAIKVKHGESTTCSWENSAPHEASNCGQLIQIECRAWFDGVIHSTREKEGLVQFEIHMLPAGDNTPLQQESARGQRGVGDESVSEVETVDIAEE